MSKSDLQLLASVNQRSGNKLKECYSHFKLGILSDNKQNFSQSIKEYKLFTKFGEEINDTTILNLGYNALGVAYHIQSNFEKAKFFYLKHKEVT